MFVEEHECGLLNLGYESEDSSETALPSPFHVDPLSSAILIEPMLTMFADILYLTHHLLHKLFYKQIIATAACSRVFQLLGRVALVIYPMRCRRCHQITKVIKTKCIL